MTLNLSWARAPGAVLLMLGAMSAPSAGCRNTWQGVKTDTKRVLDKTGEGLEKAGDKIESHGTKDGG